MKVGSGGNLDLSREYLPLRSYLGLCFIHGVIVLKHYSFKNISKRSFCIKDTLFWGVLGFKGLTDWTLPPSYSSFLRQHSSQPQMISSWNYTCLKVKVTQLTAAGFAVLNFSGHKGTNRTEGDKVDERSSNRCVRQCEWCLPYTVGLTLVLLVADLANTKYQYRIRSV